LDFLKNDAKVETKIHGSGSESKGLDRI